MFQWDKSINSLDIPVEKVQQLFRSMRDVQLALPGLPAQEATAYLCQYLSTDGVGTVAVFHLHKSGRLAFYVNAPLVVPAAKAEAVLDQTQGFVESMGFLMTDLDIHLLDGADRELLWASLPLRQGAPAGAPEVTAPEPAAPARPKGGAPLGRTLAQSVLADLDRVAAPAAGTPAPAAPGTAPAAADAGASPDAKGAGQGDVDDLLAAVEALRTRRPGIRSRRKAPGADELRRRRRELRESLGRILASH